jgi:CDP-diacylglycerol--serine O-phosphatidyltransferase
MVPNGFTLFNLFCGIYAIIVAMQGKVGLAPSFIVAGGIADALDGRVARATGTGSRFGEELDSLVDAISFGLAPALIVYLGGRLQQSQGNLDWLLVFIYSACAVMRLARFNVEQAGRKKTHFHGLPSPAAGLTLATYYWFSQTPLYNETVILFTDSTTLAQLPWHNLLRGLMAMLAALMISDVPYPAMPSIGFTSVKKFLGTVLVVGSVALLVFVRKEFIFPALIAYVLYGVVKWMLIGFLGRGSTPDQIFWEREAELHQDDDARSLYERPPIGQEAIEEVEDDEDEEAEPPRVAREGRLAREAREPRESREGRDRQTRRREERRPKRRDEGRRKEKRRDQAVRTEDRASEAVAIENEAEVGTPVEATAAAEDDTERREPSRKPDDETQRKRRRRRGRGNRGRGERSAQSDAVADDAGGGGAEHAATASGGGDTPPGPSLPDTPAPTGNTE